MSETLGEPEDSAMADNVSSAPKASSTAPTSSDGAIEKETGESVVSVESVEVPLSSEIVSKAPEIWASFFRKMEAIDKLELRVEEHVSRSRRRIMNLLEQTPSHRRTHLRMFVSHYFDKFKGIWTLAIEGKLLVGNIDHANASFVDKEGVMSVRGIGEDGQKRARSSDNSNGQSDSSDGATASNGDKMPPATTPDRSQHSYKIGEKEEDPVPPILFTHCFDKIVVTFRTIYQPRVGAPRKPNPSTVSTFSFPKKSRSNKRKSSGQQAQEETLSVDPKLLKASDPTKLVWKKTDSIDSHAFLVKYNNHFSERPPPPGMRFHSVVSKIELYPSRPGTRIGTNKFQFTHQQDVDSEPLYQIVHPLLAKRFFPRHAFQKGDDKKASAGNTSSGTEGTKSNPSQGDQSFPESSHTNDSEPIPLENDIRIPSFLSYNEISMSLFRYVQDHALHDPTDRSNILCDKLLRDIFEVESMSFGQLKQLLIQKKLIVRSGAPLSELGAASLLSPQKNSGSSAGTDEEPVLPVTMTYVMNEQTTSPHVPVGYEEETTESPTISAEGGDVAIAKRRAAYAVAEDDPDHNPTVLSFDLDVAIPSFYNFRARDLLRRVKKREFEYTTCRTKARYLLVAAKGNEDSIKTRIDKAVSGHGYEVDNIPVFLALAKAAMPHSEARGAALLDAQTSDILGRVEEANRNVEMAWNQVRAIRDALPGSSGETK